MSLKKLIDQTERGIDIVRTLEDEPIEPFISSVVLELDQPHLYGMVAIVEDLKDCLHCLEKSKFIVWGSVFPQKPTGDLYTAITFRRAIGRFVVLFTLSIPNGVLAEYNHPKPELEQGEGDF